MSVELLRNLREEDAITLDELGVLLGGMSRSGAHRYMEATELRFGQLLVLFRHAASDRVRDAILAELLPASGYLVTRLPTDLDIDGDGDVDVDDALHKAIDAVGRAHQTLIALRDGAQGKATTGGDAVDQLREIRDAFAALAHDGQIGTAIADWLIKQRGTRRQARRTFIAPRSGQGVTRG